MGRILRSFVCIIMMASAYTQRDYSYYRSPRLLVNSESSHLPQISKRVAFDEPKPKDVIIFEGPTARTGVASRINLTPNISEQCKQQGFCEEVEGYPTDLVTKVVEALSEEDKKRFRSDKIDDTVQIAQRLGGSGGDLEIELCNFTERVIYPQSAPDKNDNWYTVINLKDKQLQGVRVELCNTAKSSCNGIATMQEGYTGGCKQKYFYRMLDVLDEKGNHVTKYLKLPSCCSCVVTVGDMFMKK